MNLMKTGVGQSKYRNLTLFHFVWSVAAKVFLTQTRTQSPFKCLGWGARGVSWEGKKEKYCFWL